jgi:hypothetical protein
LRKFKAAIQRANLTGVTLPPLFATLHHLSLSRLPAPRDRFKLGS